MSRSVLTQREQFAVVGRRTAAAPSELTPTGQFLDGVSQPQVYSDPDGGRWVGKKGPKGRSFPPLLDAATSQIQQRAGLSTPETHFTTLDGGPASVQRMIDADPAFPDHRVDLASMHPQDALTLQKHMALDWMLSNHDPHSGNFLRDRNTGELVGIDKGQAFKYFGQDRLTPRFGEDLNPPLHPNVPVYSQMLNQFSQGQGHLHDPRSGEYGEFVNGLQSIPDDEYKNYLRPYAQAAAESGKLSMGDPEEFLNAATARKNNLVNDLGSLYDRVAPQQQARIAALLAEVGIERTAAPFTEQYFRELGQKVLDRDPELRAKAEAWERRQAKLPEGQKCEYCSQQATKRILHSEGMAYTPVCDKHLDKGKDAAEHCTPDGSRDPSNIVRIEKIGASQFIVDNFGPHYEPGHDPAVDSAANAWAMWAGRTDDRDFDDLSSKLIDAVGAAGLRHKNSHEDPYDASMALQNHLRRRQAAASGDHIPSYEAYWMPFDESGDNPLQTELDPWEDGTYPRPHRGNTVPGAPGELDPFRGLGPDSLAHHHMKNQDDAIARHNLIHPYPEQGAFEGMPDSPEDQWTHWKGASQRQAMPEMYRGVGVFDPSELDTNDPGQWWSRRPETADEYSHLNDADDEDSEHSPSLRYRMRADIPEDVLQRSTPDHYDPENDYQLPRDYRPVVTGVEVNDGSGWRPHRAGHVAATADFEDDDDFEDELDRSSLDDEVLEWLDAQPPKWRDYYESNPDALHQDYAKQQEVGATALSTAGQPGYPTTERVPYFPANKVNPQGIGWGGRGPSPRPKTDPDFEDEDTEDMLDLQFEDEYPVKPKSTELWRGKNIDLSDPMAAELRAIVRGSDDGYRGIRAPEGGNPGVGQMQLYAPEPVLGPAAFRKDFMRNNPDADFEDAQKAWSQYYRENKFGHPDGPKADIPGSYESMELGPKILDYLQNDPKSKSGLGRHWSIDPSVADQFADIDSPELNNPNALMVRMRADWPGVGEDPMRTNTGDDFPHEQEITLLPDAPVNIQDLQVYHPDKGKWHSVLPEPQSRTAAASLQEMWQGKPPQWYEDLAPQAMTHYNDWLSSVPPNQLQGWNVANMTQPGYGDQKAQEAFEGFLENIGVDPYPPAKDPNAPDPHLYNQWHEAWVDDDWDKAPPWATQYGEKAWESFYDWLNDLDDDDFAEWEKAIADGDEETAHNTAKISFEDHLDNHGVPYTDDDDDHDEDFEEDYDDPDMEGESNTDYRDGYYAPGAAYDRKNNDRPMLPNTRKKYFSPNEVNPPSSSSARPDIDFEETDPEQDMLPLPPPTDYGRADGVDLATGGHDRFREKFHPPQDPKFIDFVKDRYGVDPTEEGFDGNGLFNDRKRPLWETDWNGLVADYKHQFDKPFEWPADRKPVPLYRGQHVDLNHPDLAEVRRALFGPQHEKGETDRTEVNRDDPGFQKYIQDTFGITEHGVPAALDNIASGAHGGLQKYLDLYKAKGTPAGPSNEGDDVFHSDRALAQEHPDGWNNKELGHKLLDFLQRQRAKGVGDEGGLGRHWSTDKWVSSSSFAGSDNYPNLPVLVSADWDGRGEDPYRTNTNGHWPDEKEVTMLPGAPMRIRDVQIRHPQTRDWHSVLSDPHDRYASAAFEIDRNDFERTAAAPAEALKAAHDEDYPVWYDYFGDQAKDSYSGWVSQVDDDEWEDWASSKDPQGEAQKNFEDYLETHGIDQSAGYDDDDEDFEDPDDFEEPDDEDPLDEYDYDAQIYPPGGADDGKKRPTTPDGRTYYSPNQLNPESLSPARPDIEFEHLPEDPNQPFLPFPEESSGNEDYTFQEEWPRDREPVDLWRGEPLDLSKPELADVRRALYGPLLEEGQTDRSNITHTDPGFQKFMLDKYKLSPAGVQNIVDNFHNIGDYFEEYQQAGGAIDPTSDKAIAQAHPDGWDNQELGARLLDHITQNMHAKPNTDGGLGRHWTTRRPLAESFGNEGWSNPNTLPVLLRGDWKGLGEDPYRTNTDGNHENEHEVTILPGAPMNISDVMIRNPDTKQWHSVLDQPRTHLAGLRR
ncbi:hypothetical protein SEA_PHRAPPUCCINO_195 [Mycobacterium phage Phrappuccino]|uniref:Uncharacterized protein n=1 Tax=Mycobacterium phage Phrappuccino TaxID=2591223 RepID=A0A514DE37_9CAUD|nr:hypothetical protein KHQ87_gp195 [Mycobacterium phage Phrappuccino]QDH91870.1 hypothetical protein SEA_PHRAPPUCCINO_195 [Mycobacterium phage Phrappuccino]QIQ63336.1 hypothetical protein SEA_SETTECANDELA_220 [Mycobacterium phage Settecandela]